MTPLDEELAREVEGWRARGLGRGLPDDAQELAPLPEGPTARDPRSDFASNDYLSLARDPRVVEAACEAARRHGAGGRAARLLGGGSPLDAELERAAAAWLRAETALLFPSGYQANLGLVGALAGRGDAIVSDELAHASLVDACALSKARVLVHAHADLAAAERALRSARGARRRLVLTEGVFGMDGDAGPLAELDELCARHDAWLVVDEAHAAGLVGPEGAGAWASLDPDGARARSGRTRLAARVVTGGKALGAAGALVAGSRALRDLLVHRARGFVFTTAPPPPVAGALLAAIAIVRADDGRRERARSLARSLALALDAREPAGAIVPWIAGTSERALAAAARLRELGFDARAVRPPTVPEGAARLRLVCHAHNDERAVLELAAALRALGEPVRTVRARAPVAPARALFVAGTDTGVGKTVVSALLVRAASRLGEAAYWKPVQTGTESDTAEVARLAPDAATRAPLHELPLPASPHEAAAAAATSIDPAALRARLAGLRQDPACARIVVELAGGLLVPYDERTTQLDWLALEREPLVLVARSGLGTLNHTLLSLEALERRSLLPRALFLVGPRHASNRTTLARVTGLPVHEVEPFDPLDGRALDRWLAAHDLAPLLEGP